MAVILALEGLPRLLNLVFSASEGLKVATLPALCPKSGKPENSIFRVQICPFAPWLGTHLMITLGELFRGDSAILLVLSAFLLLL